MLKAVITRAPYARVCVEEVSRVITALSMDWFDEGRRHFTIVNYSSIFVLTVRQVSCTTHITDSPILRMMMLYQSWRIAESARLNGYEIQPFSSNYKTTWFTYEKLNKSRERLT